MTDEKPPYVLSDAPPLGAKGRPDRDDIHAAKVEADNLRAKSDALLKRCGCEVGDRFEDGRFFRRVVLPNGRTYEGNSKTFIPLDNAQDAIDLFMALFPEWRMFVEKLPIADHKMWSVTIRPHGQDGYETDWQPTIAAAICAAIEDAVK